MSRAARFFVLSTVGLAVALTSAAESSARGSEEPVQDRALEVTLNGLHITVDRNTGCILKLSYPGVGTMMDSRPERAGAIDLAYPVKEFEALRLASRYSSGARISRTDRELVIHWDKLGTSRAKFAGSGSVSATIRMTAAPDDKSVSMSAEVKNDSDRDVRQVIFPDLPGLLPFDGEGGTSFRTAGACNFPFLELARSEYRESYQYQTDIGGYSLQYGNGGVFGSMMLRWLDFGGLKGGLSLFPRRWGFDPQVPVLLAKSEVETKLRLMCVNDTTLKPGETWRSGEWSLTAHRQGWAKGIEPYRAWIKQNYKRDYPLPKHVREGLGFRTVWMSQMAPADPQDAIFTFKDLPRLATECKEHGIDEMMLWGWWKGMTLPMPGPLPHLGTEQEMADAVKECKRIGVNVVPFIDVILVTADTAPRYGLQVGGSGGWTYHSEMIPRFNPAYAHGYATVAMAPYPEETPRAKSSFNARWCEDVLAGTRHLVDIGIPSLGWDGLWTTADPEPNQISLIRQIRDYALKVDPESTFSGEQQWYVEPNSGVVDYTWNWGQYGYIYSQPFTSVLPTPRLNCNISYSAVAVKQAFADNLYINLTPRKPESANSSDTISNHPELSQAVKQCAKLRKEFLPYFTEGTLIGECLLAKPLKGLHACAYVLPDRAMMVLVNLSGEQAVDVNVDLAPWTSSASGKYDVKQYDADGVLLSTAQATAEWHGHTRKLAPEELTVIEFVAR